MSDVLIIAASILLWGWLILQALFGRRLQFWLAVSLSFGAGAFAVAWLLFIYMLAGGALTHTVAVIFCAFPAAALICWALLRTLMRKPLRALLPRPAWFKGSLAIRLPTIALVLFIGVMIASVVYNALQLPLEGDAKQIWGYKAKILYYEGLYSPDFHDASQIHQHPNYPLLIPILEAWTYSFAGQIDDRSIKVLHVFFYVFLLAGVYAGISRYLNPLFAASLVAAFSTFTPFIVSKYGLSDGGASSGYADMPLTFFYTMAALILLRWLSGGSVADENSPRARTASLALCAILLAAAVFTKNEGTALMLLVLAVAFIVLLIGRASTPRRGIAALLIMLAILIVLTAPWYAFRLSLPAIDENYLAQLTVENIQRGLADNAGLIVLYFIDRMTFFRPLGDMSRGVFGGWTVFWPVFLAACILYVRKCFARNNFFLTLLLIGNAAVYFLILLVTLPTAWVIEDLLRFVTLRLAMHFSAIAFILLAVLFGQNRLEAVRR